MKFISKVATETGSGYAEFGWHIYLGGNIDAREVDNTGTDYEGTPIGPPLCGSDMWTEDATWALPTGRFDSIDEAVTSGGVCPTCVAHIESGDIADREFVTTNLSEGGP